MSDVATRILGWLFLVGLGLSPVVFGGNVALAWGLNATLFGTLIVLYALVHIAARRPWPVPLSRFGLAAGAFAIVLLWIVLQAQPWVPESWKAPAWQRASELLGETLPGAISVNPGETMLGLVRLATAVAVFLLALELGREPRWATRVVATIAVAGALQAVYAMTLVVVGPDAAGLLLPTSLFKLEQTPTLTGTFINRNHFAIYLGLGVVAAWGLLLRGLSVSLSNHGYLGQRESIAKGLALAGDLGRYGVMLMPLAAALLGTSSRAGFLLTLGAVLVIVAIEASHSPRRGSEDQRVRGRSGAMWSWTGSLAVKVALGIVAFGLVLGLSTRGELFGARLAGSKVTDLESRLDVAAISMRAIADRPLTGHGYGTFASVFPLYRDDRVPLSGKWAEAHNSYIEAVLGLGIPAAIVLFVGFGAIVTRCLRGALVRKRDRLAPSVAVGATLVVACHALVDFSIQLQGVALSFAAILGAGYAQSWSSRES